MLETALLTINYIFLFIGLCNHLISHQHPWAPDRELEDPLEALDLGPLLAGGALDREAIHFHYPNYAWHRSNRLGGAIRAGRYKLIERFDDGSVELYDLEDDLGEQRDLAPEKPELAEDLRRQLVAWREHVDAAMPTPAR